MAWYTSWIPGLPSINFAVPTAIQGHFISFVLKRFLGHLLKPGQLDHNQIDSQIGSGYVQVNDLELNPEAINAYLDGLPLALQEGTISYVKARIPWPNPLGSTLGFSLKSLHLVFHVIPSLSHARRPDVDLSDSVASVAESFIHEELSPREEAILWQSFHQDASSPTEIDDNQTIPGGLDTSSGTDYDVHKFDTDPAGVSVFASLVERLLARFEFDAQDIKITLIHPGNMQLTLSLEEMRYHTDSRSHSSPNAPPSNADGESRTLSITGLSLSARNLSQGVAGPFLCNSIGSPRTISPSAATFRPIFRASSSSSMDEEAHFAMSQSLVSLPSRPTSPESSASSSMYQSAISTATFSPHEQGTEDDSPEAHIEAPTRLQDLTNSYDLAREEHETLLSFGPQPISIKLATPSPVAEPPEEDPFISSESPSKPSDVELQITLATNMIACATWPWQIHGLLQLAKAMSIPQNVKESKSSARAPFPPLKLNVHIRGIVLLLLSGNSGKMDKSKEIMMGFFQRPLIPPHLEHGYSRIHLDSAIVSLTISEEGGLTKIVKSASRTPSAQSSSMAFEFSITDLSMLSFSKNLGPTGQPSDLVAFPLLMTDPHLTSQYATPHEHPQSGATYPILPAFDIIDWTADDDRNLGTRLSRWRCRPSKSATLSNDYSDSQDVLGAGPSSIPALRLFGHRSVILNKEKDGGSHITEDLEVKIAPLHVRIDLELIFQPGGLLSFFEELLPLETESSDQHSVSSDVTVDEYSSSTWSRKGKRPMRTEDEDSPFGGPGTFSQPTKSRKAKRQDDTSESSTHQSRLVVNLPVARMSLRCPPPLQYNCRSGTVVIDLHDISIALGSAPTKPPVRFAGEEAPAPHAHISDEAVLLKAGFRRAVLACSMVGATSATAFASIGALMDENDIGKNASEFSDSPELHSAPLQPCIRVIQPSIKQSNASSIMALSVDIPAVHVDLSKAQFDALQYWADDISQLLDQLSGKSNNEKETDPDDSRDTSLIGSRFFAKSRSGSNFSSSTRASAESVIKLTITESKCQFFYIRIGVPRTDCSIPESRPFDITASDTDILVELNPDNTQQTVLTLGVMEVAIRNTPNQGPLQTFLNLTSSHSLSTVPKSIVKLRFSTSIVPETNAKETRIKLTLCGFTYSFFPDLPWISDLATFAKNPPGTFESVIPSDRTRIFVKIVDGSIRIFAPNHPGGLVSHMQELEFSTDVVGDSRDSSFHISATALSLLALDDGAQQAASSDAARSSRGTTAWMASGYALITEVSDVDLNVINQLNPFPLWKVDINRIALRLHLCADTLTSVTAFAQDLGSLGRTLDDEPQAPTKGPAIVNQPPEQGTIIMSSVEDLRFKRVPEIGPAPDMIYDDLPTNLDYLDDSFGSAAGLREIRDEDLDQFDDEDINTQTADNDSSTISRIGGETIKIFDPQGIDVVEGYFLTIPPDTSHRTSDLGEARVSVRVVDGSFNLFLYDGYDWAKTRKAIEEEVKEMRRRLAKIRQLVANGHMQDPDTQDTSAFLFNSIHIGLDEDEDALGEPAALIAAIEKELKDDVETASWQSLPTFNPGKPRIPPIRVHGKRLTRSRNPSIEFSLVGLHADFDQYQEDDPLVSRAFVTVRDLEILDHIKTSTWKKFLTALRSDSRGNVRETDSNMVRIELRAVRPVPGHSSEEARLRAKILPLRLYVDQDAVDFLKKFFSFKDPHSTASSDTSSDDGETYIQLAEIFPIDLKLDYKPRRVDYRALKEGRTIELMNFFHFDGAEMTLRHITLAGVTGWPRLFEMLNDLWTPDVKATQLMEVISGVAPIRSVVNVGSGVADLILLPIAQYKKDGRVVRGVQKGATAFVKSTAIEAIKMGAKLATGTQVILEQAEGILGGQFEAPITAETLQGPSGEDFAFEGEGEEESAELISKYAQQPVDIKEGMQTAYKSLQRNLSSAAQTILAVPMEVYERSGHEGPVRSVIRAVPIAVLKPMIGASEAVSKTLLGLHNTLDPNVRHDNEAKYKLRQ